MNGKSGRMCARCWLMMVESVTTEHHDSSTEHGMSLAELFKKNTKESVLAEMREAGDE